MVEYVTKEDRIEELALKAAEKAIEILNEDLVPMKESGVEEEGETVKLTRPKRSPGEEKIKNEEGIRDTIG